MMSEEHVNDWGEYAAPFDSPAYINYRDQVTTMKKHFLQVDVKTAVEDFYPALSDSEVDVITEDIVQTWDYSQFYDTIDDLIPTVANKNAIDLTNKDVPTQNESFHSH